MPATIHLSKDGVNDERLRIQTSDRAESQKICRCGHVLLTGRLGRFSLGDGQIGDAVGGRNDRPGGQRRSLLPTRAGRSITDARIDIFRAKLRLAERVNLEDDPDAGVATFGSDRTVEAPGPS
jgi:hypothetical protein